MTIRVKAHFDGTVFVPDEPVSVPAGTSAVIELSESDSVFPMPSREERRAALERAVGGAASVGLPLEATRREHMYDGDR
jgi:hypothetical protein